MLNSADLIRRTYLAFKAGARLRSEDVEKLLAARGIRLSANRLRELGRDSDRGKPIQPAELYELVSAWAIEQRATDAPPEKD